MLNASDMKALRAMFGEILQENNVVLRKELRKEWREDIEANNHVLKREIRDEMRALLIMTEKKIISEVTEFIGDQIVPQIDECQRDIVQLKIATNLA